MTTPFFRFAPSPNGYLHLGHARSALMNFDLARETGGRFLLRIEDTDTTRCRPEFEHAIYEDLAWLGIVWERPVRRQSEHFDEYRAALSKLDAAGLVYPSFESRAEFARRLTPDAPRDPDGAPLYPGSSKTLSPEERAARIAAGDVFAMRLDMAEAIRRTGPLSWDEDGKTIAADPAAWGDVVIARKDIPTSYHLSVVIDDALQGITRVVRGQDLYWSTSVHRMLQTLLRLPAPTYHHHTLILDNDGRKLSKSNQATAVRSLRAAGKTPGDIRWMAGLG